MATLREFRLKFYNSVGAKKAKTMPLAVDINYGYRFRYLQGNEHSNSKVFKDMLYTKMPKSEYC